MSLDYSISHIVNRLADWSGFPKYSLERRVDIFITPFLEGFVGRQFGGTARLVAPEFPLAADLRTHELGANEQSPTARTVNLDYLLHVTRLPPARSAWVFLELKTDPFSFDLAQLELYRKACARGMSVLVKDLERVEKETAARHTHKYGKLLCALAATGSSADPIEIAYLSPTPRGGFPAEAPGTDPVRFFTLSSFADQMVDDIQPEHRALWPYVRDLLRATEAASRVRAPR
jgi:hypothetical protein